MLTTPVDGDRGNQIAYPTLLGWFLEWHHHDLHVGQPDTVTARGDGHAADIARRPTRVYADATANLGPGRSMPFPGRGAARWAVLGDGGPPMRIPDGLSGWAACEAPGMTDMPEQRTDRLTPEQRAEIRAAVARTPDRCSRPREPSIQRGEHSSRFGNAFPRHRQTLRRIDVTFGFTTALPL